MKRDRSLKLETLYSHDSSWQSKRVIWAYSLQKLCVGFLPGLITSQACVLNHEWSNLGGGGFLNFLFWYVCVAQRVKKKKKKKPSAKFGVLTDFLSNLRLLKLKVDLMLGIRTELFLNFEPLKCKFSRNLWFQANVGSWGTKKFWNGGFREGSGGRERGVLRAAHNCTPFSAEYPPPGSRVQHGKIQSVKLK